MNKSLLLLGGGGHCASIIDTLQRANQHVRLGIVAPEGADVLGVPVVGVDNDLSRLKEEGYNAAFVAVGSVGDASIRAELYKYISELGFETPNIIDPTAIVSESALLGKGIFIGKRSVIGPRTRLGNNSIINTGAIIEHDCNIGNNVHIAPGSTLCGSVNIGNGCHVGAGATVIQGISIGEESLVGAGAVVIHSVCANKTVVGCPAKPLEEH